MFNSNIFFTELQEGKGIVLMRGEYDDKTLKAHEAQCLTNQLQLYYGGSDNEKLLLPWKVIKEMFLWQYNQDN
ncbi:hypothetical protein CEXT_739061 [Caerostris extrusa]|uniref:Uncharacterized protein n=1 Tax=Caerostris extrusa TaxID=172846 RepID=A0AAV4W9G8_CAEEX|nr:hypothetical protein CEXT_739061 [Caerostris extrusa]